MEDTNCQRVQYASHHRNRVKDEENMGLILKETSS